MGELAGRLDVDRALYQGLRPEALAMALYIGAQVRSYAGGASPLIVTSTVRDQAYQDLLVRRNREATRNYSLHTTGWAFDVARVYRDGRHAEAFQFVLDRLQAMNVIAWVREPDAIHITRREPRRSRSCCRCSSGSTARGCPLAGLALGARRPRGRARGGPGLVGRARVAVGVEQRAVDLERAGDRLAGAAGQTCSAAQVGPIDFGTKTSKRGNSSASTTARRPPRASRS